MTPISLEAKEGLALINGTQLITSIGHLSHFQPLELQSIQFISVSLGAEACERAGLIAKQADVVAALTLEVLKGTSRLKPLGDTFLGDLETFYKTFYEGLFGPKFYSFLKKLFAGLLTAMCTPCVHTRASSWSHHPHFHHQF